MTDTEEEVLFDEVEDLLTHTVLHNKWTFWYLKRANAKTASAYEECVLKISNFHTIEHFFRIYDHLIKPNDIKSMDYHLFKNSIKPAWEDENNKDGGKWMIRLKKGLASLYWEELIFAMVGEQFDVGNEICGAVISMREKEDVISVWNKTADNIEATGRIKDQMRKILKLPSFVSIEYRRHMPVTVDKVPLQSQTSYGAPRQMTHRPTERSENVPREHNNNNGAREHNNREGYTQPRYPRNPTDTRITGEQRTHVPRTAAPQSNPAWKPTRPVPVGISTGDPLRDAQQEAATTGTNYWAKSMRDKGGEQTSGAAASPKQESTSNWTANSSKEPSSAWRKPAPGEKKPPTASETARVWARGKVADTDAAKPTPLV